MRKTYETLESVIKDTTMREIELVVRDKKTGQLIYKAPIKNFDTITDLVYEAEPEIAQYVEHKNQEETDLDKLFPLYLKEFQAWQER